MSTKQMFSFNNLTQDTPTEVVDTPKWTHLADYYNPNEFRILSIRPRRRTYLRQSDAGYDWCAGHGFIVTSQSSPYCGQVVAIDETRHLKDIGYTHVHIHYNLDTPPLKLELH